ncbi:MAG: leucine-rich repeat protein [Muribaculaceae bacterium]|nr:leucine-rich repeat protein [Muribaculaceae bacterium]
MRLSSYIILTLMASMTSLNMSAAIEITPGQLEEELNKSEIQEDLVISGNADIRDLVSLKSLPATVKSLDLQKLKINSYDSRTPAYLGKTFFKGNRLPAYIFFRSECNNIRIPDGINIIEAGAFAASDIEEIIIPEGVTEIEEFAFYDCKNLRYVTLPSTLTKIGKGAFANCPRLCEINLESTKVTRIPEKCFEGDSALENLELYQITEIGSQAFSSTALTTLYLPSVSRLDAYALAGMSFLSELTMNADAEFNEGVLMNNGNLVQVSGIPADVPALFAANCVSYVPADAIGRASSIGNFAFSNSAISEIVLGRDLTTVGKNILHGSDRISHIDATALGNYVPATEDEAFDSLDTSKIRLLVNDDSYDTWASHPVWGRFDVYTSTITGIENEGIADNAGITITIADGYVNISGKENLEMVRIWDTSGAILLTLKPDATTATVALESLPSGIVIVNAKSGMENKSVKLII